MPVPAQPRWSEIKPKLTSLTHPELLDLVKDLFHQSDENRLFLMARFSPEALGEAALEPYRKKIVIQFFPSRGFGKLNLKEARQAIRDYRKTTSDLVGTLELMMTYVEQGTEFTNQYGDIDEAFYASLESVLGEIAEILKTPRGQTLYPQFRLRLLALRRSAGDIGWGYGDTVEEIVKELEDMGHE